MESNYTTYLKSVTPEEKEMISNCIDKARTKILDSQGQVEGSTSFQLNVIASAPVNLIFLCQRTALKSLQCKAKPITAQEVLDGN